MGMQTSFPVFEADQVLTNTHLNDLRKYLDEQNRLTRVKLVGCGIVCGLEITSSAASIKISKGCGLTSQGYLLMLCDSEFTHSIPYTAPEFPGDFDFISQCASGNPENVPFYKPGFTEQMFQLITGRQLEQLSPEVKNTAVALSKMPAQTLRDLAVVLFLEAEQLKLKNCDTNDCNDKGSRMDFEPKVLLVPKKVLDRVIIDSGNKGNKNPLPQIELRRYNVPVANLLTTSAVLGGFANIADNTTIEKIATGLNACYTQYDYLLEEGSGNPFGGVANSLKALRQKVITTDPLFIQYFYDFLDDIIKAYYEFREKAYYVNSECCIDEMRFPLHLMLGEATSGTVAGNQSAYREYFIYSPLFDSQGWRLNEIRFLFTRLKILLGSFTPDNPADFGKREIKITPSRFGKDYLSERCIPYYYHVSGGANQLPLYRQWNYKKTMRGEPEQNLSYKSNEYADSGDSLVLRPLLYDLEQYNFFRVEGHIGKQIASALPEVVSIKQEYNLPVEVIALSADYIGAILKGEDPQCIIQDLESDYRIIIAEFICKLHDAFCNIYKFDFKPKPITAGAAAPIGTALAAGTTARRATRGAAAAADTNAATPAAGILSDDDDEVNELIGKTDFSGLKVSHPALSKLVSEAHLTKNYTKGSSLLKLCGVRKGSIGDIYLSNISSNIFSNPVSLTTNVKAASLYFRFFELIDSIESMFKILLTNELAELNLAEFKIAYNRYEKEVNNLSKQLRTITDKVQVFLSTCIVEKLEALKDEYRRRINQYNLAMKFNNYFKKHGGIEHKAGVPTGGTFILVYHEDIKGRRLDVSSLFVNKNLGKLMLIRHPDLLRADVGDDEVKIATEELQTAVESKCPEQFTLFNKAITDFLKTDVTIPASSKEALLAAIRKPPEKPGPNFASGTVIADFYVPYICCSDCTPVSYVLQPTEPLPLSATTSPALCNEDGTRYTVKISVTGGIPPYTFSINDVTQPDENIILASGSPDTKVKVKDTTGKAIDVTIKSHACPAPCNLPCNGKSTSCHYIPWVPRPQQGKKIIHESGSVNLKLTNEGQVKNIDLTQVFKQVFASEHNTITHDNYASIFKKLLHEINALVPPDFIAPGEPMFTMDQERQLLIIDKFDCQDFALTIEVALKIEGKTFKPKVIYDKNGLTMKDGDVMNISVPPFGCIQKNKCTGEIVNRCTESLRIGKIIGSQVTFNQPDFDFTTKPQFDMYFWYFHSVPPFYSSEEKPRVKITEGPPLVRVIGIKKATGCFAVLEARAELQTIVG